mgnify:CR=1 FL=1
MVYGYARVSSKGQAKEGYSLEVQEKELREAGASEVFFDAFTGTTIKRPEFDKLLEKVQSGDTIIVTRLDRIARTAKQGLIIVDDLMERGIEFRILNMGVFNNSPFGKLSRTMMFAFAEFEHDTMIERMNEGKRTSGNFGGRKRKYTKKQLQHAVKLLWSNSYNQVSAMTGISKSTLQRAKKLYADI